MTSEQLKKLMPGVSQANADKWAAPLALAMERYAIDNPARVAMFVAQIGHESGDLTITAENMNYSAERLLEIFPRHFTAEEAKKYARVRDAIGNRAYANRMGNGPESSGDGYRYRGRGLMQMTGRNDYRDCGLALDLDLLACPELLDEPETAALSAGWEWDRSKINPVADLGDIEKATRIINGGLNGYADRVARWNVAKAALGIA